MKEKGGVATELCGFGEDVDVEAEKKRLQQVAMSWIEPPVAGLRIQEVKLEDPDKLWQSSYTPRQFQRSHCRGEHASSRSHVQVEMMK